MKRPLAYITAAWSGNECENAEIAARYCRQVYEAGYSPICPILLTARFVHDGIPQEHKDSLDIARDFVVAKSAQLRFRLTAKTAFAPLLLLSPQSLSTLRGSQKRSRVLVVCGRRVDETVKNDIATAERLHITASSSQSPFGSVSACGENRARSLAPPLPIKSSILWGPQRDGILTVKGQGRCDRT